MFVSIKQLYYFAAIVKSGSIRKASEKLGVSQPTISGQIVMLEKTLGVSLLERSNKGVTPSPVGRTILPHIQKLLQVNNDIINLTKDAGLAASGTYSLGVPHTLGPYLLPEVIPKIHKQFPALRFFVKEDTPFNLERGLLDAEYDLILTPLPLDIMQLSYEPILEEPLYVIAAPDHALATKKSIMPDDFVDEYFLVVEERHRFFSQIQQLAKDFGFNLLRDYEGNSLDTLRQMIGVGMGVSFLPSLYIRSEIKPREDVIILDLDFALPKRQIAIAWRQNTLQKKLYQNIGEIIREVCEENLSDCVNVLGR